MVNPLCFWSAIILRKMTVRGRGHGRHFAITNYFTTALPRRSPVKESRTGAAAEETPLL